MIIKLLIVNLALLVLYMTIWFALARKRKRLDTVDSAWGGGYAVVAWAVAVQVPSTATLAIAALITVWSGRLTNHIASRSRKAEDDPRYTAIAKKWKGSYWLSAYLYIFLTQALLIWLVSLPVVMAAGKSLTSWQWLIAAGIVLWVVGFVTESIADRQLAHFISDKTNKGKVLDTGLWHYSRHPNYFGELLQWWAIGLIAVQAAYGWIGLLGPALLSILIIFVSGIPPIEKRRKDNPAYQEYKRHTSTLVPLPPKP